MQGPIVSFFYIKSYFETVGKNSVFLNSSSTTATHQDNNSLEMIKL
jgi:hypothetical protein